VLEQLMVNFAFSGRSVISAVPENQGYIGNLVESRIF
jgi:hypothetical protein